MNTTLHVKLSTKELSEKVKRMREFGFNVPALIRNFLINFPLEKNSEQAA